MTIPRNRALDAAWGRNEPDPSERQAEAEAAIRSLLRALGEDIDGPDLEGTPAAAARAWGALLSGYQKDPIDLLKRTFEETNGYDGMVLLTDIPFVSVDQRDLLPFRGVVHIAYLPRDRVVGLSKLPRLVLALSQRLQTEGQLVNQIAETVERGLDAVGVAVIVESSRRQRTAGESDMSNVRLQTGRMLGRFLDNAELRSDFFALIKRRAEDAVG